MLGIGNGIVYPHSNLGRTAHFDGVSSILETTIGGAGDANFSFSFWFKPIGDGASAYLCGDGKPHDNFDFRLNPVNLGAGLSSILMVNGNIYIMAANATPIDGEWHNIAIYFDKDAPADFILWYDGVVVDVLASVGSNGHADLYRPIVFGGRHSAEYSFVGELDQVLAFDGAINTATALVIYQRGRDENPLPSNSLVKAALPGGVSLTHFYQMGEGTGDVPAEIYWANNTGVGKRVFIENQVTLGGSQLGADKIFNGGFATGTTLGDTGSGFTINPGSHGTIAYDSGGVKLAVTSLGLPTPTLLAVAEDGSALDIPKLRIYQLQITYVSTNFASQSLYIWEGFDTYHNYNKIDRTATGTFSHTFIQNTLADDEFGVAMPFSNGAHITIDDLSLRQVGDGDGAIAKGSLTFK